uniref:hypothetical protein n=1 Tax=Pedobacter schmidteae TaxID=2201271 RepID=UPI000EAFD2B8|nr:hypothetical protein [Pedobacter schmidteae]
MQRPVSFITIIFLLFVLVSCKNQDKQKKRERPVGTKNVGDSNANGQTGFKTSSGHQQLSIKDVVKQAEKQFAQYLPKILKSSDGVLDVQQSYTGDFTGDGIADVAIYFSLSPAGGGNAIIGQGLVLYKNEGNRVKVIGGYEPDYLFKVDTIRDGKIMVEKMEYAETDGRCCPSVRTKHTLTISGNKAY